MKVFIILSVLLTIFIFVDEAQTTIEVVSLIRSKISPKECGIESLPLRPRYKSRSKHLSKKQESWRLKEYHRIKMGNRTQEGEFPWTVMIKIDAGNETKRCSGVILNEEWILTVAHCMANVTTDMVQILAGSHFVDASEQVEKLNIDSIYLHPKYFDKSVEFSDVRHDLALLMTTEAIDQTLKKKANKHRFFKMNSVCFPTTPWKFDYHDIYRFSGWGMPDGEPIDTDHPEDFLRGMKLILNPECDSLSFHCAYASKSQPISTCSGDSGGPLVVQNDDGRFYLAGIFKSSDSDDEDVCSKYMSVFVNVVDPENIDWIVKIMTTD